VKPAPHTPGPWRVYQEKPHYYSVGTDYAHDRGHDCNVARDIRCEANARIMAAAPELLKTLESIAETLDKLAPCPEEVLDQLLAEAQSAIRKAKL
jgi:hypothetical protein